MQRALAVLMVMVGCTVVAFVTFARTTVPYPIEGEVEQIEVRSRGGGNTEIHIMRLTHDADRVVDRHVATLAEPGARVSKPAWSTTVSVDDERSALLRWADLARTTAFLAFVAVVVVLVLRARPVVPTVRGAPGGRR